MALCVWLLGATLGCTPRPPPAPTRGLLELASRLAPPAAPAGPARVVLSTPTGEAAAGAEVAVVFDGPVRALGPDEPPIAARIEPAVAGRWHWVGTSALRFAPDEPLPPATAFEVELAAALPSLPGRAMPAPHRFRFETPRPRLVSSDPPTGARGVSVDAAITLTFNHAVDLGLLEKALTLRVDGVSAPLPFELGRDTLTTPHTATITPRAALPGGAAVTVELSPALRSRATGLPMGRVTRVALTTQAPFRVVRSSCTLSPLNTKKCDPAGPLHLVLSGITWSGDLEPALSVTPALPLSIHETTRLEDGTTTFEITLDGAKPNTTYTLKLAAEAGGKPVADYEGRSLTEAHTHAFALGDYGATVAVFGAGTYWPADGELSLRVQHRNVSGVQVRAAVLTQAQWMAHLAGVLDEQTLTFGAASTIAAGKPNALGLVNVPLVDLIGDARGPVFVEATAPPAEGFAAGAATRSTQTLVRSEVALYSTITHQRLRVWVTGMSSGRPLVGADVEVRRVRDGVSVGAGKTDADGLVNLPLPAASAGEDAERYVALARLANDWTYQHVARPDAPPELGIIFTGRGLYRPGETVNIKGVVRVIDASGAIVTPEKRRVTVVVRDAHRQQVRRFTPVLSEFGTWHRALKLPADVPLGWYHVELLVSGKRPVLRGRFQVAEYEPVDFTLGAHVPKRRYLRGDTLSCTTSGRYLHGGPMAGAKVLVDLARTASHWAPKRLSRYTTTDSGALEMPRSAGRTTARLDAKGKHRHTTKLALPGMLGPERISCNAYGSDYDERSLAASDSTLVHRVDAYLGLRQASSGPVYRGEDLEVDVHATNIAGQPLPLGVEVKLLRRTRDAQGDRDEELDSCSLSTGNHDVTCTLAVPDEVFDWPSKRLVVRATARTDGGVELAAAFDVVPHERSDRVPEVDPPEPKPRREKYLAIYGPFGRVLHVGQNTELHIDSPFERPATALVTVSRGEVVWQRRIVLPPAGMTLHVPITANMIPTARVRIIAFDGPVSKVFADEITVSSEHRRLDVRVVPSKKRTTPGGEVEVAVSVRDRQGKPVRAEVTLYGADEATLELAYYRTPDPMQIHEQHYVPYAEADARDALFTPDGPHPQHPPRVRMGASGVSRGDLRHDFRQTVLFEPGLITDSEGWVRRTVTLPDGLTRYRFMAVAVAKGDQLGSGEQHVVTNKPLMVRAKMPAVVRVGDKFMVNAIVSAHTGTRRRVTVDIATKGLTLTGSSRRTVTLEPNVPTSVKLELAAPRAGPFEVVVGAVAAGSPTLRDAMQVKGTALVPTFIETVALFGATQQPVAEMLGDLSAIRRDVGGLTVSLSSSPFAELDADFDALLSYPYGCTEQTASRMLPIVALGQLSSAIGVRVPKDKRLAVADAVNRLHGAQQADGGFGLWTRSTGSNIWLTAYVTWVLSQARRASVFVPNSMFKGARDALTVYLEGVLKQTTPLSEEQWSTAAFVVDVLGEIGQHEPQAAKRLFASRRGMPLFGRSVLLHALAAHNLADREALDTLVTELAAGVTITGEAARVPGEATEPWQRHVFLSSTTALALTLRAIAAARPSHPLIHQLATGLIDDLRGVRPHSTHDSAWALVALDAYRRAHPTARADFLARVFVGDELLAEKRFGPGGSQKHSVTVPAAQLAAGRLTFDVRGSGSLHYRARLRYAKKKVPDAPLMAGFTVVKTMTSVDMVDPTGPALTTSAKCRKHTSCFAAGELVRVDVRVVNTTTRYHVVVDDPLPGGLRAVDPNMRTGLDEGPWQSSGHYDHRELRDDRALFFVDELPPGIHTFTYWARARSLGTFVLPPTEAHEMYAPEIRGATPSSTVTVR